MGIRTRMRSFQVLLIVFNFILIKGQECEDGFYTAPAGHCAECETGYYCVGGEGRGQQPCPEGTYNDQIGQSTLASCLPCSGGSYSSSLASASCSPCATGFYCPRGSVTEFPCPVGMYSLGSANTCLTCPSGSSCISPAGLPRPCADGYYSNEGSFACDLCPSGFKCPGRRGIERCPAGSYSSKGEESCTECGSGSTAVNPQSSSCDLCPPGHMCPDPSRSPILCPLGYVTACGNESCHICPTGQVSSSDRTSCGPCPSGHSCSRPTSHPDPCISGTYSKLGDEECLYCPAGSHCPYTTASPIPCSNGEYSTIGASICSKCPGGRSCPTTSSAVLCTGATYSSLGDTSCHPCRAGYKCPDGSDQELLCGSGTYSLEKASECLTCPAGYQCPNPFIIERCPDATYSPGGLGNCIAMPRVATYSSSGVYLAPSCAPGEYHDGTNCQSCPVGSYCVDGTQYPCSKGYYSKEEGSYYCKVCPPGHKCPDLTDAVPCDQGSYSVGGTMDCKVCPAGSYCPYVSQNVQLPCAPGSYSDRKAIVCEPCPAGNECPTPTSSGTECSGGYYSLGSATKCTPCSAGWACPSKDTLADRIQCSPGSYSTIGKTICITCPPGYFCPFTDASVEIECADGFASNGSQSSCKKCPPGFYCADKTAEAGNPCDPGTYALGGAVSCTECPAGFYCSATDHGPYQCNPGYYSETKADVCLVCDAGSECSDPTKEGVACEAGFWSAKASIKCSSCEPGYVCKAGSTSATPPSGTCEKGKYCDGKTALECPEGTYNSNTGAESLQDCLPCPQGKCCPDKATESPTEDCPMNHYCPKGTSACEVLPCPGGYHNPDTGKGTLAICKNNPCPAGKFCGPGESPAPCPKGFFCLRGQASQFENPCPPGTYSDKTNLKVATECTDCPVGHYCPFGSEGSPTTAPMMCPQGTYNPDTNRSDRLNCHLCDAGFACPGSGNSDVTVPCDQGHYCPNGTIEADQFQCPPGTYTEKTDLWSAGQCSTCPTGYYCSYGTTGFIGTNSPNECPMGYYCPAGTTAAYRYPCPPGFYSNITRNEKVEDCLVCPESYYCSGGQSSPSGQCPPGYYCPEETASKEESACPPSTYNPDYGKSDVGDCLNCTKGNFCETATVQPQPCPVGTYMPYGVDSITGVQKGAPASTETECLPCPGGYTCDEGTVIPDGCGLGLFSQPGNSKCQICMAGYYCDRKSLSFDDMIANNTCPSGYYCADGLDDQSKKEECPTGRYCPEATPEMVLCPPGTINDKKLAKTVKECLPCPAGFYCLEASSTTSGECHLGFYCPTDIPNLLNDVDLVLVGSSGPKQVPCPAGTYRDTPGAEEVSDCMPCPAGRYCPLGSTTAIECVQGSFCLTNSSQPTPCPKGTYGDRPELKADSECTNCTKGKYCDSMGMLAPRGDCDPGFICYEGASISNPNDNITGVACPIGGYCPAGSYEAWACPQGYYSNTAGQKDESDCIPCPAGSYCNGTALPHPTGKCWPGFYCVQASFEPDQNECSTGTFCKEGSVSEQRCPIGTYQDLTRSENCSACTPGRTCPFPQMNYSLPCPPGSYCPSPNPNVNFTYDDRASEFVGTYLAEGELCPPGTYNPATGSSTFEDCLPCPQGMYCSTKGADQPSGKCSAGYICYNGSTVNRPTQDNSTGGVTVDKSMGEQCMSGHWCPEFATWMIPCPEGSYNPSMGKGSVDGCKLCPAGKFCSKTGMSNYTGACDPGFYCAGGASSGQPKDSSVDGGAACPVNSYCNCTGGCNEPQSCLTGSYTNETGQAQCQNCNAGYFCQMGQSPILCPNGSYCIGSKGDGDDIEGRELELEPKLCPAGTFNSFTGLTNKAACQPCPGGKFCDQGGDDATGDILPGYYSKGAAKTDQPDPNSCKIDETGASYDCGPCTPGHYCIGGQSSMDDCPVGTFSIRSELSSMDECDNCTAGCYCNASGLAAVAGQCEGGWFCGGGSTSPRPTDPLQGGQCEPGYECPKGSSAQMPCTAGTYSDTVGQVKCDDCPAGYYCPPGSNTTLDCPAGFYCKRRTPRKDRYPCPLGTYNENTNSQTDGSCLDCKPGSYCGAEGLPNVTDLCDAGWFCSGKSKEARPTDSSTGGQCQPGYYCRKGSSTMEPCDPGQYCGLNELPSPEGNCTAGYFCKQAASTSTPNGADGTGGPCPSGHYCPSGTSDPQRCGIGTFQPNQYGESESNCQNCTEGDFCDGVGQSNTSGPCDPGFYCPEGQSDSSPHEFICPKGYFCPSGSSYMQACTNGTYQDEVEQDTCKTCPAGFYCDASVDVVVSYNQTECPEGYFCPNGTKIWNENPCAPGSYNNMTGAKSEDQCVPCQGGYYCPQYATSQPTLQCSSGYFCQSGARNATPDDGDTSNLCPRGFYCPLGTVNPFPCPPGTYSPHEKLNERDECLGCDPGSYCAGNHLREPSDVCDAGFYCPGNSTSAQEVDCDPGYFCLSNSSKPTPCPAGTYSNATQLESEAKCSACLGGQYCDIPGLTEPKGNCTPGFYCPPGSEVPQSNVTFCPVGSFCPAGTEFPLPCEDGYYTNWTHAYECEPCPDGSYCANNAVEVCPPGNYCPSPSIAPTGCPRGTFTNQLGLANISQCLPCLGGYYCDREGADNVTAQCDAGFYCTSGVDRAKPDGANSTTPPSWCFDGRQLGYGGRCPVGYFCRKGASFPEPCPAGTYAASSGQSHCDECREGYYCVNATGNYIDYPCPAGSYCENGTDTELGKLCPPGTFNNMTARGSELDCRPCTGGAFCSGYGLDKPNGVCPSGYYCPIRSINGTENKCPKGSYCPEGSIHHQLCSPGFYCADEGLGNYSTPCQAGFYCTLGASVQNPHDNITGNSCPEGTYCTERSPSPLSCPVGTYLNITQATDESDCLDCQPTYYCDRPGLDLPTDLCDPGFFCPGLPGQRVSTPTPGGFKCPVGHFCVRGSDQPERCPSGQYQSHEGQWSCLECPERYYCDNKMAPVVIYNDSSLCPPGHYCPIGTEYATQYPCQSGTFYNVTGGKSSSDCLQCTRGMFCSNPGLPEPEDWCHAGYFCSISSNSPTPVDNGTMFGSCPPGFHCPNGTSLPYPCPPGTYNPDTNGQDESWCRSCSEGSFCPDYNMTTDGIPCDEGFYCPNGSSSAQQSQCPPGYYCPPGVDKPRECPPGSWSDQSGLKNSSQCLPCYAGYYCPRSAQTTVEDVCEAGFYCLSGQDNSKENICPLGFHCLNGSETYHQCPPGTYSNSTGQYECDDCPPGFYCLPVDISNVTLNLQECPQGYYCPLGTGKNSTWWRPCPAGSYGNRSGLATSGQCIDCDPGYYCEGGEMSTTDLCAQGHYCTSGVDRAKPGNGTILPNSTDAASCSCTIGVGGICPVGHYCKRGASIPELCDAGQYANKQGASECQPCPEGYFCLPGTSNYQENPCPSGHVCPEGTKSSLEHPCPPGTYNPSMGAVSDISDCLECRPGRACTQYGLPDPDFNCSAGYYCPEGSDSETQNSCPIGSYCLEASEAPRPCPTGYFCPHANQPDYSHLCDPGFFCLQNASVGNPTDSSTGYPCPAGLYCETGTQKPEPCPPGTYSNKTERRNVTDCQGCEPGFACSVSGLSAPDHICAAGYTCPGGDVSNTSHPCPSGHRCTEGSSVEDPCPSGMYQDREAQAFCSVCPQGFVCNATLSPVVNPNQLECPQGYYCPNGTKYGQEHPCPPGTFNDRTGLKSIDVCTPCLATFACDQPGLPYPVTLCSAGYYCRKSSNSTTPDQADDANVCPPGSYCVEGTDEPHPCPYGTFSASPKVQQESDCDNCSAGYYCNNTGLTGVSGPCEPGYYCPEGSNSSQQITCPPGSFCALNSSAPQSCPISTYSNTERLESELDCQNCTAGFYCDSPGRTNVTGQCQEGYYCPPGSSSSTQESCWLGYQCPTQSSEPKPCGDGFYAPTGSSSICQLCPPGKYCLADHVTAGVPATQPCPEGYYCPEGTGSSWQPCPRGSYSNKSGLANVTQCTPCDGGYFCDSWAATRPRASCSEGYYCQSGSFLPNPTVEICANFSESPFPCHGGMCPVASYCQGGSEFPKICNAGTYNNKTKQSECRTCEAGYYCLSNTTSYMGFICPEGFFCPPGTEFAEQYPCGKGSFNNETGAQNSSSCQLCPAKYYCDVTNLTEPVDLCLEGYYCEDGSETSTGRLATDNMCPMGSYCPSASAKPTPCDAGWFCDQKGLSAPAGQCNEGYYCPSGSTTIDDSFCPPGSYCVKGTPSPEPCPNGTYGKPSSLLGSVNECTDCDPGFYCNGVGRTSTSDECSPGYFCSSGSTSETDPANECTKGHRCPKRSKFEEECNNGFYQDQTLSPDCKRCPEKYYCPNSGPISMPTICPQGHYCQVETTNPQACRPGSYNQLNGSSDSSDCLDCSSGFYCQNPGSVSGEGDGPCDAGFYCDRGSTSKQQFQCPESSYCPAGTSTPYACPTGTYTTSTGNKNITDCGSCPAGQYCTDDAATGSRLVLPCSAGYICSGGSNTSTPNDPTTGGYPCPAGFFCLAGDILPNSCQPGSYQPTEGANVCLDCPAGFLCPSMNMTALEDCPAGFYCPKGSSYQGRQCPKGRYSNTIGLEEDSECLPCPPGRFCDVPGETDPSSNLCTSGYYCKSSSESRIPADDVMGNGPCPPGFYCPEGTRSPQSCPGGTYRDVPGGQSVADCFPCPAKKYCLSPNGTSATDDCSAGYYCPAAANITTQTPTGYECPAGYFCVKGSEKPEPCPPGTRQPYTGQSTCLECDAGYYCPQNATELLPCPLSKYCTIGSSTGELCPSGTYGNRTGLSSGDKCLQCPAGHYCVDGTVSAPCSAGFQCISGSNTPIPDGSNPTGGPCPIGYYCTEGTVTPYQCPTGLVINNAGASSVSNCTDCPAGFVCTNTSIIPQPCSPGFYCPYLKEATPCPSGSWSDASEATSQSTCELCPAGYWCPDAATANPHINPCPVGHYCPPGTGGAVAANSTVEPIPCPSGTYRSDVGAGRLEDCSNCPAGYYCPNATTVCFNCTDAAVKGVTCEIGSYCPAGSSSPSPCEPGYYCPQPSHQLPCPEGNYCPQNSSGPIACPDGYYCIALAIAPDKCPLGTYQADGSAQTSFEDTCITCPAGTYGGKETRNECTTCKGGVICLEGAITDDAQPGNITTNNTKSFPCPPGYYCPAGALSPMTCPMGTFNPDEFGSYITSCSACQVDYFNNLEGQLACFPCGAQASQPLRGQSSCRCVGSGRDFQPSDQQCPCAAGYRIDINRGGDCVQYVYPICAEGRSRSQLGDCFDDDEWNEYCETECGSKDLFQGVDKVLGLCKCSVDDLDSICDVECRTRQRNTIKFHCPDPLISNSSYIRITFKDGTVQDFLSSELGTIINSRLSIFPEQCTSGSASSEAIFMMETGNGDFLGVYDPDPLTIAKFLEDNARNSSTASSGRRRRSIYGFEEQMMYTYEVNPRHRNRHLFADSSATVNSGISSPIMCLENGAIVLFTITNTDYPVYDPANLYNTNEKFDYGGFRRLIEAQLSSSVSTLFSYRFNDPGVYSFYHSSDETKKFFVRVMDVGGTCTEIGPYFPQTPRFLIQSGIALRSTILLEPDWLLIGVLIACSIALVLLLILSLYLFRKYGWRKVLFVKPLYREKTKAFNFDNYSSKGSTVYSAKKFHRNLKVDLSRQSQYDIGCFKEKDEFWDYERQIDLEAFSSQKFYSILNKQSNHVTSTIGMQKNEVKSLYQKIAQQTQSLKDLWAAKLNLGGRSGMSSSEDLAAYERKKEELEIELERRKQLGEKIKSVLQTQRDINDRDRKERETHQAQFSSLLKTTRRLVEESYSSLKQGVLTAEQINRNISARFGSLINQMTSSIASQSRYFGCWAVIDERPIGIRLANPESEEEMLSVDDIFDHEGRLLRTDLCFVEKFTGLMRPHAGARVLLPNGTTMSVPAHQYFVHRKTGQLLSDQGHLCYDPISARIVITAGDDGDVTMASGSSTSKSVDERLIPYVAYPHDERTGRVVDDALLTVSDRRADLRYSKPIFDAMTGLSVPICAVTIHPETGNIHPLGGTYKSPVTNLPVPIEIGDFMFEPETDRPVPIISVAIDQQGKVIPIGGTISPADAANRSMRVPIVPGNSYLDPQTGNESRISSVRLLPNGHDTDDVTLVPCSGGYDSYLEQRKLTAEVNVVESMRLLRNVLTGEEATNDGVSFSASHEVALVERSVIDWMKISEQNLLHGIRSSHDLTRREEHADILSTSGGCSGTMQFPETGQLLPILVGTWSQDPSGSNLQVPILGIDKRKGTGEIRPLLGSMEDSNGRGLIPIMIGVEGIDSTSGKSGKVVGARVDKETDTVVPVIQNNSHHHVRVRKAPTGSLPVLEDEIAARKGAWRRLRHIEQDMEQETAKLRQELVSNMELLTAEKVDDVIDKMVDLSVKLKGSAKSNAERREVAQVEMSSILPGNVLNIVIENDEDEAELEGKMIANYDKLIDTIRQIMKKLQSEEDIKEEKLREVSSSKDSVSRTSLRENALMRYDQARSRIQAELMNLTETKFASLDFDSSQLESSRQRSELLTSQARDVLRGSHFVAYDYVTIMTGIYGDDVESWDNNESIPLMKQLIALLESGMNFNLSVELLTSLQQPHTSQQKAEAIRMIQATIAQQQQQQQKQQQRQAADGVATETVTNQHNNRTREGKVTSESLQKSSPLDGAREDDGSALRAGGKTVGSSTTSKDHHQQQQQRVLGVGASEGEIKIRDMMERHAIEVAALESQLRKEEIDKINQVIQEAEARKSEDIAHLKKELKEKIKKCSTPEEKEQAIMEYSKKMEHVSKKNEKEKGKRLEEMRRKLMKERQKRKKELYDKHFNEAKQAGLDPVKVIGELIEDNEDQIQKDLLLLQEQQDKLIAELRLAYAEDEFDHDKSAKLNAAMEAKIRMLNAGRPKPLIDEETIEKLMEEDENGLHLHDIHANMKDRMKMKRMKRRQSKNRLGKTASGEEAEMDIVELADGKLIEQQLLSSLIEAETEKSEENKVKKVKQLLDDIPGIDQTERDRLLTELAQISENIEQEKNAQKHQQKIRIAAKLTAKKKLKEELFKEKSVKIAVERFSCKLTGNITEEMFKNINQEVDENDEKMFNNQVEKLAEVEKMQIEEKEKLNEAISNEEQQKEKEINEQLDEMEVDKVAEARENARREIEEKNLNEKDSEMLMKKYRKQAESYGNVVATERSRQLEVMRRKMKEKKKNKEKNLADKHQAETERKLLEMNVERYGTLTENKMKACERKALMDATAGDVSSADKFVHDVLLPRHLAELADMSERLKREEEAARKEAKSAVSTETDQEREEILARHEKEVKEYPKDQIVRARQKKELQEFAASCEDRLRSAEQIASSRLVMPHTEEKLKLREKHLRELADIMRQVDPEQVLVKQFADEAEAAAQRSAEERKKKRAEYDVRLQELKRERKIKEEKVKNEIRGELAKVEEDLARRSDQLKKQEEDRMLHRHRGQQEQEDRKEAEIRSQQDLSEDEKERLLKEHRENLHKLQKRWNEEKNRAKEKLMKKLKEKQEKQKQEELERIRIMEEKSLRSLEIEEGRKIGKVSSKFSQELKSGENDLQISELAPPNGGVLVDGNISNGMGGNGGGIYNNNAMNASLFTGMDEWNETFMNSSFYQELSAIEEKLRGKMRADKDDSIPGSNPFLDIQDAQWEVEGKDIKMVEISKLSPSEFVIYKFGLFVVKMICMVFQMDEVKLLVGSKISSNNYHNNAFRHSFAYQRATRGLYIRRERLTSVGDYVIVVIHCLSHIHTDHFHDDADPYFLRAFYKALKITCEDLFFARSLNSTASSSGSMDTALVERSRDPEEKKHLVECLIDLNVATPTSRHFSTANMTQRMTSYRRFCDRDVWKLMVTQQQGGSRDKAQLPRIVRNPSDRRAVIRHQIVKYNEKMDDLNRLLVERQKVATQLSKEETSEILAQIEWFKHEEKMKGKFL